MQAEFEKALGPPTNPSPSPTKGPSTPQAITEVLSTDVHASMLPTESLNPPVMYSSTTQISDPSNFNPRASWLAGKPVHGNAFLTYTKIRHTGWLVPAVVFNSDFTLEVFWQWMHGLLPEVEYVNRAGSALVSRLPSVFRSVIDILQCIFAVLAGDKYCQSMQQLLCGSQLCTVYSTVRQRILPCTQSH